MPEKKILSISFDLPTQMGYDSDHPFSEGQVGRTGVAIDSIEDMQALFRGIRLEEVSTSMNINATGYILLAFYTVLAKQQGADLKNINGTIRNEYRTGETYIYPPEPSLRIISDMADWCSHTLPKWEFIQTAETATLPFAGIDEDRIRQIQTEKLESLKRRRDPARIDSLLQYLNDQAASDENIMPVVVEAAENLCTLGEIADTLREVFGEYKG